MNASNAMLCWTPGTDRVAVVPWPDRGNLSAAYEMTALACWADNRNMGFDDRKIVVFCEAVHLMVRDKMPPLAVHEALLALEEYRDGLAEDMPAPNANSAAGCRRPIPGNPAGRLSSQAMRLTDTDRALIEHALDSMAVAMHADATTRHDALLVYERAIALVRDRPAHTRRLRSDFNRPRRNAAQMEIWA